MVPCECAATHDRRRIVLTGGPGAGKTAVLELIRQAFCSHVRVLPEAASVVFGGGFPREEDVACQRASQRAIYYVQRELESAADGHNPAIVLCDRGTIDGAAYWLEGEEDLWSSVGTTEAREVGRYHAVIHLRTPGADRGYNHQNPLRTESAAVAADLDARILAAWARHPRRFVVEPALSFLDKAAEALALLRSQMPACCQHHVVPALRDRVPARYDPGVTVVRQS